MFQSTVLLTLAGHAPSNELLSWRNEEAELSIAVDGGWLAYQQAEVEPDVLLGDFDSCGDLSEIARKFPRIATHHLPDQNHTDFEKAIQWVLKRGVPNQVVVLGGLGKQTDHCLSNLMIAARIPSSVEVVFDDVHEFIGRITPETPFELSGRAGCGVSLLPMGVCEDVHSTGLEWDLDKENFSWDSMVSQSNRCISDRVRVSCQAGVLFAFISKET